MKHRDQLRLLTIVLLRYSFQPPQEFRLVGHGFGREVKTLDEFLGVASSPSSTPEAFGDSAVIGSVGSEGSTHSQMEPPVSQMKLGSHRAVGTLDEVGGIEKRVSAR